MRQLLVLMFVITSCGTNLLAQELTTTNLDSSYTHFAQTDFQLLAILVNVPDDYTSIQEAINAVNRGDTILVAPGTYVENIDFIGKDVIVMSAEGPDVTRIDGNQNGSTVLMVNGETEAAVLDGFTIFNGNGTFHDGNIYGGGIYISNSSPHLKNLIVTDNAITRETQNAGGGIAIAYNAHPHLSKLIIKDNQSDYAGGGLAIGFHSNPVIESVAIQENSAEDFGGGVIIYDHCAPLFNKVTIVNNACYSEAGGIQIVEACKPVIINSIIWGNSELQIQQGGTMEVMPDTTYIAYSNVQAGLVSIYEGAGQFNWLEGNIDADPCFGNPMMCDFSLQSFSPCIDAGVAQFSIHGVEILDMATEDYLSSAPDMGACEYNETMGVAMNLNLEVFTLHQNYPNPFNPTTTISYTLPEQSRVKLTVFNVQGQQIVSLQDAVFLAGNYQMQWNGIDHSGNPVSTGLYLCRLQAGIFSQTIKMVYLR